MITLLLGKRAEMSSQYVDSDSLVYMAEEAVDGMYLPNQWDSVSERSSLAHTLHESQPWWRVDLAAIYCIWAVNVINRAG